MNRKNLTLIAIAGTSVLISGCAMLGLGGKPDPRWADYKNWQKLNATPITGDHTGFLGGLHEGAEGVREVYINDTGYAVANGSAPYDYPVGTVVAKEQYKNLAALEDGKSPGLTIMVKVSDDAENAANNWIWSAGYGRSAGENSFCSSCHTIAASSDYVFSNAETLAEFR